MNNIAITANTSWYIYNFRKNTIIELINRGITVHVISPFDDYTVKLRALGCMVHDIKIDGRGINPVIDALTCLNFLRLYLKIKPQAILNFTPKNNIYSSLAAAPLRIPVINNIAGLGHAFINDGLLNKIVRALYKISQQRAEYIFSRTKKIRLFSENIILAQQQLKNVYPVQVPISHAFLSRRYRKQRQLNSFSQPEC